MHQLLLISFVILLCAAENGFFAQETSPSPGSECSTNSSMPTQATVAKLAYSFGGLEGFYDIATGIADGLHGTLKSELMQRFADTVSGDNKDVGGLVSDVLKNQAGFIIFVIIGLLFIFIFPITGCCYCACRCCCNRCGAKRYQKEDASKTGLIVLLVAVVVCFAFILTGTIIYGASVTNGKDSFESLNADATKLAADFGHFVNNTADQMICGVEISVDGAIDAINKDLMEAPNKAIDLFTNITGLNNLLDIIASAQSISNQLNSIQNLNGIASSETNSFKNDLSRFYIKVTSTYPDIPSNSSAVEELNGIQDTLTILPVLISEASTSVNSFLVSSVVDTANNANGSIIRAREKVNETLVDVIQQVRNAKEDVDKVVSELRNLTTEANGYIDNATDAINDAHEHYEDFGGKNALIALLSVVVVLPCVVVLVLIVLGSISGAVGYRKEFHPQHRTNLSHAAGYVAIATCIFLFTIGASLMLLSTVLFTAGYALQFGCQPLFYDNTYQVFDFVGQYIPNITNPIDNTVVQISVKDAITGCEQSQTVYSAVKGDRIFNIDQILGKIQFNASTIDTHINASLDFVLTSEENQTINNLQITLQTIQQYNIPFHDPATRDTVQYLNDLLNFLNQQSNSDLANEATSFINRATNLAVNQLAGQVQQMKSTVPKMLADIDFLTYRRTNATQAAADVQNYAMNLFNCLNQTAYDSLGRFQENLKTNIANCRPLYDTWQNVGDLVCKKLGHPLQGLWASLGLTVLFFIPIIVALTLISKYLYRMDSEHYEQPAISTMYGDGPRHEPPPPYGSHRVAPEVANVPQAFISDVPETPIKKSLDSVSDKFRYEPDGNDSSRSTTLPGEMQPETSDGACTLASAPPATASSSEPPSNDYDPHAHIKPRDLQRVAQ